MFVFPQMLPYFVIDTSMMTLIVLADVSSHQCFHVFKYEFLISWCIFPPSWQPYGFHWIWHMSEDCSTNKIWNGFETEKAFVKDQLMLSEL